MFKVKILIIFLMINFFYIPALAQNSGKDAAGSAKNLKDVKYLKDNFMSPLVTSDSSMPTIQDQWLCSDSDMKYSTNSECINKCNVGTCELYRFDAGLMCDASYKSVSLNFENFLPTGEAILSVHSDGNLDGVVDKIIYTFPISSICNTGYASCDPGTQNNCKYFELSVPYTCNQDKKVSSFRSCIANCKGSCSPASSSILSFPTSLVDLGGTCSCVNKACNRSVANSLTDILNQFSSIASSQMSMLGIVSEAKLNNMNVDLISKKLVNCSNLSDANINKFKSGYNTGVPDYGNEFAEQSNDPRSLYSLVTAEQSVSTSSCFETNSSIFNSNRMDIINYSNCEASYSNCKLRREYCEPLCPANSLYNPKNSRCIANTVKANKCPDGFTPIKFSDFGGWLFTNEDEGMRCGKVLSTDTFRGNTPVTLSFNYDLSDTIETITETFSDVRLFTSIIREHTGGDARLCLWGDYIVNYKPVPFYTNTFLNDIVLGHSKYINDRWVPSREEVFRTNAFKIEKLNLYNIRLDMMLKGCGTSGSRPTGRYYLWLTTEMNHNYCPSGWLYDMGSVECYIESKNIASVQCKNNIYKSESTFFKNNYAVVGNGIEFVGLNNGKQYKTNQASGIFTVKKTYECINQKKQKYDYTDIEKARDNINLIKQGNEYIVTSYDKGGNLISTDLSAPSLLAPCTKVCKIKSNDNVTSFVTPDGDIVNKAPGFEYKQCNEQNICEYDSNNQVLLKDCSCDNDFGKAASIMSAIDKSAGDRKCIAVD